MKILIKKRIFIVIDEADIEGKKYCNTLIRDLEIPIQIYFYKTTCLSNSINSIIVISDIICSLNNLNVDKDNFNLLISDAAPYMKKAGRELKILYKSLFHITCIAHLMHNCAMHVKSNFHNVDNLIAS